MSAGLQSPWLYKYIFESCVPVNVCVCVCVCVCGGGGGGASGIYRVPSQLTGHTDISLYEQNMRVIIY